MDSGIGREFLGKTRYKHLGPSPQQKGAAPPLLQIDFSEWPAPVLYRYALAGRACLTSLINSAT